MPSAALCTCTTQSPSGLLARLRQIFESRRPFVTGAHPPDERGARCSWDSRRSRRAIYETAPASRGWSGLGFEQVYSVRVSLAGGDVVTDADVIGESRPVSESGRARTGGSVGGPWASVASPASLSGLVSWGKATPTDRPPEGWALTERVASCALAIASTMD